MDLDLDLDLTLDAAPPPVDRHTDAGLAHAGRGDWHAAASEFAAATWDAESSGDADEDTRDARLAAALTNLGQARAYLGALDEAATLLARSATLREGLVARGAAGADVHARGLTDLAAVQAAAGNRDRAIDTLRQAQAIAAGGAHSAAVADGLGMLGAAESRPAVPELPWLDD